eukprot:Clim_evm50s134 gene=Clim_evmTU50s134
MVELRARKANGTAVTETDISPNGKVNGKQEFHEDYDPLLERHPTEVDHEISQYIGKRMTALLRTSHRYASSEEYKPLLRGFFHEFAFFTWPVWGILLLWEIEEPLGQRWEAFAAGVIFLCSLAVCYGTSGQFHRRNWDYDTEMWVRKFDHAAIVMCIAGSWTVPLWLVLPPDYGRLAVSITWSTAMIAICYLLGSERRGQTWISMLIYIGATAAPLPFLPSMYWHMTWPERISNVSSLLTYGLGMCVYKTKWPGRHNLIFGFHELWHICTLVGGALSFWGNYLIIHRFIDGQIHGISIA